MPITLEAVNAFNAARADFVSRLILEERNQAVGPFLRAPQEEGEAGIIESHPFAVVLVDEGGVFASYQRGDGKPFQAIIRMHGSTTPYLCLDAKGAGSALAFASANLDKFGKHWRNPKAQVWARSALDKWNRLTTEHLSRMHIAP